MPVKPLKRGPTPLYHQISAILRNRIEEGDLRVGERIPTEDDLCSSYNVSRATVRQALQTLVQDGLVVREPGRGSFVAEADQGKVADVKMTCLLDDLIALGIPAVPSVSNAGIIDAMPRIAKALGLSGSEKVFSFLRILEVEKKVFTVRKFFLPDWVGNRLSDEDLLDENLLKTISTKCDVQVVEADQIIEAVMADAELAALLDVDAGAPLLSVTRTSYTHERIPVEHSTTYYRSDRTRFLISQRQRKKGADDWVLAARGAIRSAEMN
jgi:GntR family transcriptional regulator